MPAQGAVAASVPLAGLRVLQGQYVLRRYTFNTHAAAHFFCGVCGIYTHHQRRSRPDEYGYNVGCLDGLNPYAVVDAPVNDGVNHPADRSGRSRAWPEGGAWAVQAVQPSGLGNGRARKIQAALPVAALSVQSSPGAVGAMQGGR